MHRIHIYSPNYLYGLHFEVERVHGQRPRTGPSPGNVQSFDQCLALLAHNFPRSVSW